MTKKDPTARPVRGYGPADVGRAASVAAEAASSLPEIVRIAAWRRWYFLVPACIACALTLASSLYWPREYTARCKIERLDDLSLSGIVNANSPFGFSTYRLGLPVELYGYDAVREAVEAVGMSRGLPRDAHGEYTPEGRQRLQELAQAVSKKVELAFLQKSDNLDLIEVTFRWSDPVIAQRLLTVLKDNYIEKTKNRILERMKLAYEFFKGEEKRFADRVTAAEKALDETKQEARSDPSSPTFLDGDITKFEAEKALLYQKKKEHDTALKLARKNLESINEMLSGATSQPTASAPALAAAFDGSREVALLEQELRRLEDDISDQMVVQSKKPEHPEVKALIQKRDRKRAQLERLRKELQATSTAPAVVGTRRDLPALVVDKQKTETHIALLQEMIADVIADINMVDARIAAWQAEGPKRIALQQRFRSQMKEYDAARLEHRRWEDWRDQVQRFITAEASQRGIQLTTKEEPQPVLKASSPTFILVIVISLAVGIAVGVGVVVLVEFVDRSYRTATQVARSLGIPILQAIDEIVTPEVKLRRFVRRMVVLPTVTVVLVVTLVGSASLAYLSLEQPNRYQRWRASPQSAIRELVDFVRMR